MRDQVAIWPAPLRLAAEPPAAMPDRLVFAPAETSDEPGGRYRCVLCADGSALVALSVGSLRSRSSGGEPAWAVGEGALVWILIASLRVAAAYAGRSAVDELQVEAAVVPPSNAPLAIWNHGGGVYDQAGRLVAGAVVAGGRFAVADGLSPRLARAVKPLVVDLLRPFDIAGDRHIDSSGALRENAFTGFSDRIREWAAAMGVPSRP